MITGKVRSNETEEEPDSNDENFALTIQDRRLTNLHKTGGGEYLSQRSWQGLEQNLGESEPAVAQEGQKGIAWGYDGEGKK